MKIKFIILLFLFLFPLTSAIDLEMKTEFNQGETLLLKFSGNFLDKISKNNIFFYRDHVRIPTDFKLMNVGNDYYVYASLNNKIPRNYSVSLENVRYYSQGKIVEDKISKNFTITENFADFSINPGFVETINSFEVELKNLQDKEITIKINEGVTQTESESGEQSFFDYLLGNLFLTLTGKATFNIEESNLITLSPNEIKKISFELGNIPEPILKTINFSTTNTDYNLPIYIFAKVESVESGTNMNETTKTTIETTVNETTTTTTTTKIIIETTTDPITNKTIKTTTTTTTIETINEITKQTTTTTTIETTIETISETQNNYSPSLDFRPSELRMVLYSNLTKEKKINLVNIGNKILENISLELSNNLERFVNISKTNIYDLEVNASSEITLNFKSGFVNKTIQGELTAKIPNETEDLSITFQILIEDSVYDWEVDEETGEEIIGETNDGVPIIAKSCREIRGTIFEEPKKCSGEIRFAKDGNCCIGKVETPVESNTGLIIGWAIILCIILALVWFFKFKYKSGKEEIDLFKIAKGKR